MWSSWFATVEQFKHRLTPEEFDELLAAIL
jgi:hypothetical protein